MKTLDTNIKGYTGEEIDISGETMLTLYLKGKKGSHKKHRVGIEVTPDGTNWFELSSNVKGLGTFTWNIAALKARPLVTTQEGEISEVLVALLAK